MSSQTQTPLFIKLSKEVLDSILFKDFSKSYNWILDDLIGQNQYQILNQSTPSDNAISPNQLKQVTTPIQVCMIECFDSSKVDIFEHCIKLKQEISIIKCNYMLERLGLILIIDEFEAVPETIYEQFDYVLRNHTYSKYKYPKSVQWFPIGYSAGFHTINPGKEKITSLSQDRKYFANFIGNTNTLKGNNFFNTMHLIPYRKNCVSALKICQTKLKTNGYEIFIHETDKYNTGLSKEEYKDILKSSVFTLCPAGSSPESTRIYEALEVGSIPIIQENTKALLFGDHPMPTVTKWSELPSLLDKILNQRKVSNLMNKQLKLQNNPTDSQPQNSNNTLTQLQEKVKGWYLEFKQKYKTLFQEKINPNLSPQISKQLDIIDYLYYGQKLRRINIHKSIQYLEIATMIIEDNILTYNPATIVTIYNQMGVAYSINKEYQKAIDSWKKMPKYDNKYPAITNCYFNIACDYYHLNNKEEALKYINMALATDPDSKRIKDKLSEFQKPQPTPPAPSTSSPKPTPLQPQPTVSTQSTTPPKQTIANIRTQNSAICNDELKKLGNTNTIAFYTVFCGDNSNIANRIPAPPKDKDCYFFSNNKETLGKAQLAKWTPVYLNIPIKNNDIQSAMDSKHLKACPHLYPDLAKYHYTVYLDSKLNVEYNKVITLINKYRNYPFMMRRHEFLSGSVHNEFNLAMDQPRYLAQKEQYQQYIKDQTNAGLQDTTPDHLQTGFIIRNMQHPITSKIGETWHSHIQKCGIECQISFYFVKQLFEIYIIPIENEDNPIYQT